MDHHSEIQNLRTRIEAAKAIAAALANPAPPPAVIRERVAEEIEALRQSALDRVPFGVSGASGDDYRPGRFSEFAARLSAIEVAAVLNPKALGDFLIAQGELEAGAGDPQFRLDAAEAAGRLAKVELEIAEMGAREELYIRDQEELGASLPRRRDADPAVVLAPTEELRAFVAEGKQAA